MKSVLVLVVLMMISSCSGYFDSGESGGSQANTLAIENGGGYLSGPSNDITPFLYRDTNGNNPVLFFSSDRDGTYDIYYAVMNEDGSFQSPVKMDNISTDNSNEISPIVGFVDDGNGMLLFKITCIRQGSKIVSGSLTENFSNTFVFEVNRGYQMSSIAFSSTNLGASLWVFNAAGGVTNFTTYWGDWDYTTGTFINDTIITNINSGQKVYTFESNNWKETLYIYEKQYLGHKQILLSYVYEGFNPYGLLIEVDVINQYASPYNDRWPYVDFGGNGEVYFASDRGVNGDYDLFRYNELNYHEVVPQNPFK